MKDFETKQDNVDTSAGSVNADDFNALMGENKNAVSLFLALSGSDSQQLAKAVDISSKAIKYVDGGSANVVQLSRPQTAVNIETLKDGMSVLFIPAYANTGAATLQIGILAAKAIEYAGSALTGAELIPGTQYIATYNLATDAFDIDVVAGGLVHDSDTIKDVAGNDLFEKDVTGYGFQKLPNGLIIQWGTYAFTEAIISHPYAMEYPNASLGIIASLADEDQWTNVMAKTNSNSHFKGNVETLGSETSLECNIIAIGY